MSIGFSRVSSHETLVKQNHEDKKKISLHGVDFISQFYLTYHSILTNNQSLINQSTCYYNTLQKKKSSSELKSMDFLNSFPLDTLSDPFNKLNDTSSSFNQHPKKMKSSLSTQGSLGELFSYNSKGISSPTKKRSHNPIFSNKTEKFQEDSLNASFLGKVDIIQEEDGFFSNENSIHTFENKLSVFSPTLSLPRDVLNEGYLPPISKDFQDRHTLILDLDETLIHTTTDARGSHFFIEIRSNIYYVSIRPFVRELLLFASKHFEVVLFTASSIDYATAVLDKLDPEGIYIHHRLHREHCTCAQLKSNKKRVYIKDLAKLGRELSHIIIVDNNPMSYACQPRNSLSVSTWIDNQNDRELWNLIDMLSHIALEDEVYPILDKLCLDTEPLVY